LGALLTHIAAPSDQPPRIKVRVRTGRVAFLVGLCVAALAAAAILHGLDRETAAAWFTGMGEALLFVVLGLVVGETLGAMTAAERLRLE
jgi:high-affinity Fe2+/Pb2+ permease